MDHDVRATALESTSLDASTSFLLARASALATAAGNRALAEFALKVRSYSVLNLAVDIRPSQRELSERLRLDPSQIVALVDGLEARGLVERRPDPNDRRAKIIAATASGTRLFERALEATVAAEREAHAALTADERDMLRSLLQRIAFDA